MEGKSFLTNGLAPTVQYQNFVNHAKYYLVLMNHLLSSSKQRKNDRMTQQMKTLQKNSSMKMTMDKPTTKMRRRIN